MEPEWIDIVNDIKMVSGPLAAVKFVMEKTGLRLFDAKKLCEEYNII